MHSFKAIIIYFIIDGVINHVQWIIQVCLLQCQTRCDETTAFVCRSLTYFPTTSVCRLSGDDNLSAGPTALAARRGANYYQKAPCVDCKWNNWCMRLKLIPFCLRLLATLPSSHCLKITQNVAFWHFQPFFTCLVTLFDRKFQVFENSPNFFGILNELLSTQNVNVAP